MKAEPSIVLASILALFLFTACGDDPSNFYGADKEMEILDEEGDATTNARVSLHHITTLTIVGGIGEFHLVEVQNEDVISVNYSPRYAMYEGPVKAKTVPAELRIRANEYGSTVISITDTDIDKTIHVKVTVVDHYAAMTILESTTEGIEADMYLAFRYNGANEYRFVSKEGKEYDTFESGEYHFMQPVEFMPGNAVYLALNNGDTETLWRITDADNNKDGHKLYISDVYIGMKLPSNITTKLSYTEYYPTEFLFTDTSDPARTFKTTAADTAIQYTFPLR